MAGSFETKLRIGFALAALCLASLVVVVHWNSKQLRSTGFMVAHTREVLANLESVLTVATDAETNLRGYVISESDAYLQTFTSNRGKIAGVLSNLVELTRDNEGQHERIEDLGTLVDRYFVESEDLLGLMRQGGGAEIRERFATGESRRRLAIVRAAVSQAQHEEERLLQLRVAAAEVSEQHALLLTVALALVVGGLLFGGWQLVRHHLAERKRTEQAISAARSFAESVVDSVWEPLVVLDGNLRIQRANRAFHQTFQTTPEEAAGRALHELGKGWEVFETLREHVGHILEEDKALDDLEIEQVFPRVGRRYLRVGGRKLYRPGNHTGMVLLAFEDRSEMQRLERERVRFFDTSHDLLCIADMHGRFKTLNASWEKTLGHTLGELEARPYFDFVHPDDLAATEAEAAKLADGRSAISFENRYRCKDGSYRWLQWIATPQMEEGLIYAAARDVTEHKRAEEEIGRLVRDLRERAGQLEAVNRELEAFSYSVSHDLRAPLRHVNGFCDLLKKHLGDSADDKARRYMSTIESASQKMGTLIDELLVFSRMGRSEMQQEVVSLDELVAEVLQDYAEEIASRKVGVKTGALPVVRGDRSMLRQVFLNLISNALKYSRTRNPARIEIGSTPGGDEDAVIFVRDNGVGFDPAYAHKLFGVFQRLHRAEDFEGTGIGLANVRRIVLRHGGRVWAESRPDEGATFFISLLTPGKSWQI